MPSRTPNLFLVGPPRSGTTALYTHLGAHPDIYMSPVKELHFFSTDLFQPPPQVVIEDEKAYLAMFERARGERWLGEASPFYFYSTVAPASIKSFSPDARVVVTLRNPADMMYSMYCLGVRAALFHQAQERSPTFEDALADGPARLRGESLPPGAPPDPGRCMYLCYWEMGRYAARVERLFGLLGRDNVHVVVFDNLRSDTPATYAALCRFLEIDSSFTPDFDLSLASRAGGARPRNPRLAQILWRPSRLLSATARTLLPVRARAALRNRLQDWNDQPPPPLHAETRRRILDECAADVRRVGALIGQNLDHWLVEPPRAGA